MSSLFISLSPLIPATLIPYYLHQNPALLSPALSFLLGLFLLPLISLLTTPTSRYSLAHGILNVDLPPTTYWMNLGFWDTSITTLPHAASRLLRKLLEAADLDVGGQKEVRILDLGIGCGDQTRELSGMEGVGEYTGITKSRRQCEMAAERVGGVDSSPIDMEKEKGEVGVKVKLYCGDASDKRFWPDRVDWVLALDCLYHFSPSRAPVFEAAAERAEVGVAVFDLILGKPVEMWEKWLLMVVCGLMGIPWVNMVSEKEYVEMMVRAGWEKEKVVLEDVSGRVFKGLEGFLKRQDEGLMELGVKGGIGWGFRIVGWVVGWWKKGAVRAVIVVARK